VISSNPYSIISTTITIGILSSEINETYGAEALKLSYLISGLFVMIILFTNLVNYIRVIPRCVMDAYVTAITLIIFQNQIPYIFSLDFEMLQNENLFYNLWIAYDKIVANSDKINYWSIVWYFGIVAVLTTLLYVAPEKPWVLMVCLAGVLVGYWDTPVNGIFNLQKVSDVYAREDKEFQ
jgi:MFS superfamily sulfate permease-like transporter